MRTDALDGAPHATGCMEAEYGNATPPGVIVGLIRQLAFGQGRQSRSAVETIVAGATLRRCRIRLRDCANGERNCSEAQDARSHAIASRLAPSTAHASSQLPGKAGGCGATWASSS